MRKIIFAVVAMIFSTVAQAAVDSSLVSSAENI